MTGHLVQLEPFPAEPRAKRPPGVEAYYAGGRRAVIGGVPCRVAAWWRPPGSKAGELALIRAAADAGAGILELEGAPRFRFEPAAAKAAPAEPYGKESDYGGPGPRGSYAPPAKPHMRKLKNWRPARLSLEPMYGTAMAGDPPELTRARREYAKGKPELLRAWLKRQALARSDPAAAAKLERAEAVAEAVDMTADALEHAAREIRRARTSGRLVRALTGKARR